MTHYSGTASETSRIEVYRKQENGRTVYGVAYDLHPGRQSLVAGIKYYPRGDLELWLNAHMVSFNQLQWRDL